MRRSFSSWYVRCLAMSLIGLAGIWYGLRPTGPAGGNSGSPPTFVPAQSAKLEVSAVPPERNFAEEGAKASHGAGAVAPGERAEKTMSAAAEVGGVKSSPKAPAGPPAWIEPLPEAPPADITRQFVDVERNLRIAQLLKEVEAAQTTRQKHRILLTVAGYQVGKGDWQAAKDLYEKMASEDADPDVLSAVGRNLHVVKKNLEIEAAGDADAKEWLQLELATIHSNYGHQQAAKRIWRELAKSARQEGVREKAARLQKLPPAPANPPAPSIAPAQPTNEAPR